MKRIVFFYLFAIIAVNLMSQSAVDKIFDKYSGQEGFTTVYITKYMFDLFRDMDKNNGNDELEEAIGKLNSIKILATDGDAETKTNINLYTEVMKELPESDYKELMVIKEKNENVKFLIKEKNKIIEELLLLVGSPNESVLIIIQGDIDMKNIAKIAESMDIKGMEKLEEMEK